MAIEDELIRLKKKVESLDTQHKRVQWELEQAMKEATTYGNKIAQEENDQALEGVKKAGKTTVYIPTKEERMALKKAMAPVHVKMADRVGKETLQEFYKVTGFDPNKL